MASPASPSTSAHGVGVRDLRYDVGFDIPGETASRLAVTVCWPRGAVTPPVWFCLPGGAMNRHFYDLRVDDPGSGAGAGPGSETGTGYSFARRMAGRGFVSVLVDPPGIGDSDRPADGYALTPERLVAALTRLHARVCEDLRAGRIDDGLPPMEDVRTIGLGHSMGAMLTVLQQAAERPHAAIALLGFGIQGLPDYLPPEARALAQDTEAVRERLVPFARQMFVEPYPELRSAGGGDFYGSAGADRAAVVALKTARDRLLPVPAFMSILPGNVAPEAAAVDVPVYLGFGGADFIGPTDDGACGFTASPAVERQMLPGTGHSFFLFDSREALFDGLARWARVLAQD